MGRGEDERHGLCLRTPDDERLAVKRGQNAVLRPLRTGLALCHTRFKSPQIQVETKADPGSSPRKRRFAALVGSPTPGRVNRHLRIVRYTFNSGWERVMANILLAEDDESLRRFLAAALVKAGHAVTDFGDGEQAYDCLKNVAAFDLLLTDIVMPGVGGIELAKSAAEIQ